MNLEIFEDPLTLEICGYSGTASRGDYSGTAFKLMDRMWKTVKSNQLKNKGQNIWVYESEHKVFAGVELIGRPNEETDLEYKRIYLSHYARFKHIGSYNLISRAGQDMKTELLNRGYEIILPYIEIYGHWTQDETKLETELLMTLK